MKDVDQQDRTNAGNTVLRGLTWDHPRAYRPLEMASRVHAANTGVDVIWDRRSLQEFGDQPLAEIADRYDILVIDHPHVGVSAARGFLLPLDDYIDGDLLVDLARESPGKSHQSYNYGGHQWALAIDAACQVAACRRDLPLGLPGENSTAQLEWPATWDNVLRLAEQLRANGQWMGMALCPTDCGCSFLTLSAQHGMQIRDETTEFTLEPAIAALDTLANLKKIAHPDSANWNPIQLYEVMTEYDDIVYCPLAFGYSNYCHSGFRRSTLAFGPIPELAGSLLGGAGLAVSRHTSYPGAAVRFVAYAASEDCQSGVYAQSGGQPAHRAAWQTPTKGGLGQFTSGTFTTIQHSFTRSRTPWWPTFQMQLEEAVYNFLDGRCSSSIVAREISDAFQRCRDMR